jgi:hypothetical protein
VVLPRPEVLWLKHKWWLPALAGAACAAGIGWAGVFSVMAVAAACSLAGIIVVAVLQSDTLALGIILVFAMIRGGLELAGIPTILTRAIAELAILVLFFKAIYVRGIVRALPIRVIGLFPMAGLLVVALLSLHWNDRYRDLEVLLAFLLALRDVFLYYCLFVALLNLGWPARTMHIANRIVMVLFLIQIPVAFVKLLTRGVREGVVGTVSLEADQLSTVLPLFVIAFLFSFYLYQKKAVYLLLILGFIFFGWVGSKRALPFLVPVAMLLALLLHRESLLRRFRWESAKPVIVILIIGMMVLYAFTRTLFSLNPDRRFGGRFDPLHVLRTAVEYETFRTDPGQTEGRLSCTLRSYEILKDQGLGALLVGLGPGQLRESSLLSAREKEEWARFGLVRGHTGFVWFTLQVGLVGVLLLLSFYYRLFRVLRQAYLAADDSPREPWLLGLLTATGVLVLDFCIYSNTGMFLGILTPAYFYLIAVCLRETQPPGMVAGQTSRRILPACL